MQRNLKSWKTEEITFFMKYKEEQYEERRKRVKKACNEYPDQFSNKTGKMMIMYDKYDKVDYCGVPKAASSTWCFQFIQLG